MQSSPGLYGAFKAFKIWEMGLPDTNGSIIPRSLHMNNYLKIWVCAGAANLKPTK